MAGQLPRELKTKWKEAVVANLSLHLTEENHKALQYNRCFSQNANQVHTKYKSHTSPLQLTSAKNGVKNVGMYAFWGESCAASYSSEIPITRLHTSGIKNFFRCLRLTIIAIKFPFEISHQPRKNSYGRFKRFPTLRGASEYPIGICDGKC
jgi:hypothetical protein